MFGAKTATQAADTKRARMLAQARAISSIGAPNERNLLAGIYLEVAAMRDILAQQFGEAPTPDPE